MRCRPVLVATAVGCVLLGVGCAAQAAAPAAMPGAVSAAVPGAVSAAVPAVAPVAVPAAGPSRRPVASEAAQPGTTPSGSPGPSGSPSPFLSPSPSTGPVAELRTAVADLQGQNLAFALGDGIAKADGRYDATTDATRLARIEDGRLVEVSAFGSDLYLAGFAPDGAVLKVNLENLQPTNVLVPSALPLLALRLLTGVTKADVSVNTYTGRLDLTKVDPGQTTIMRRFVEYLVQQAGEHAGDIAFTATVDGFGRLASFHAILPRADGGHDLEYELAIREIGTGVAVPRPSSSVSDAPGTVYAG